MQDDGFDRPLDRRTILAAGAAVPLIAAANPARPPALIEDLVDWPAILARHDLIWDRLPRSWGEAPFLGNGRLALSMTETKEGGALSFALDNVDVYDRRDFSWGWPAYSRARYHVGDFLLQPVGRITGARLRLDLHRAELTGEVVTDRGAIRLRAFVHAEQPHMAIELETSGDEAGCAWTWHPTPAVSTRPPVRTAADAAKYEHDYGQPARIWVDNPPGERRDADGVNRWFQPLLAGGGYTTAWAEQAQAPNRRTLVISNAMSFPDSGSLETAARNVRAALAADRAKAGLAHRRWWDAHHRASFLSLPDTRLESFYWIQIYKYGCIARPDGGVIDTHGPWLQPSNWPYLTWNLNVQISTYALQPSNRLALAEGLFHALDTHRDALRRTASTVAPGAAAIGHVTQQDLEAPMEADRRYEKEWGNLLWVCQLYWLQYRYTMDRRMLRERLLPLLAEAVALYYPILSEKADGRLHLGVTYSPEIGSTRDCNYDLALLRWGIGALIEGHRTLGTTHPMLARWRDIAARLTPYPVDEHGYRVGADMAVQPHRHYSHLMMIYPLYLENRDTPAKLPLLEKSTAYWLDTAAAAGQGSGWSLSAAASFHAAFGKGDAALGSLKALVAGKSGIGKSFANTMYAESGQNIETPLSGAQSIHDMVLQSWGGAIRVFPAIPTAWPDLIFSDFRAEGAFLVSARRIACRTAWVRVKSLAGEPCVIECDWGGETPILKGAGTMRRLGDRRIALSLHAGEEAALHLPTLVERLTVSPLPAQPGTSNSFGVHGSN
ncbi:hypothetical protein [Sphingomonas sp. dw_22]|uniref:glycosyl hydrolase family 95 catalytic domain-containing protein n=1 Tax=Sphingomonas sp. dw_22 TaxID=2721175 RepID=UPI001BD31150|nr:hypothetical protein [Sphingomonas sp. dw_22]